MQLCRVSERRVRSSTGEQRTIAQGKGARRARQLQSVLHKQPASRCVGAGIGQRVEQPCRVGLSATPTVVHESVTDSISDHLARRQDGMTLADLRHCRAKANLHAARLEPRARQLAHARRQATAEFLAVGE